MKLNEWPYPLYLWGSLRNSEIMFMVRLASSIEVSETVGGTLSSSEREEVKVSMFLLRLAQFTSTGPVEFQISIN